MEAGEPTIEKIDYESLRQKLRWLKEENERKKEKYDSAAWPVEDLDNNIELAKAHELARPDPHFDFIDPEALTEDDLWIFKRFIDEDPTLTMEDLVKHRRIIASRPLEERKKYGRTIDDPRQNFVAWLINKMMRREFFRSHND